MERDNNFIRILNIDIVNTTTDKLLKELTKGVVFTPNVDHLVKLQQDELFYRAYQHADVILLDSQVLFYLYRCVGKKFKEKIAGVDFFSMFCYYHRHHEEITIFVLGGLGNVAEKVRHIVNSQAGRSLVVGAYSPSIDFDRKPEENETIIQQINNSGAIVLAIGVGAPKQEKWIYQHKHRLPNVKIFLAIGAALDFISGVQKRAPVWMQNAGLEWLYRLLQEPRRLFKRYVITDVKFFYYFFLERLHLYKNPFGD